MHQKQLLQSKPLLRSSAPALPHAPLVKVSTPVGCALTTPAVFDVPNTPKGAEFVEWWTKTASTRERIQVAKYAHDNEVDILDAMEACKETVEE